MPPRKTHLRDLPLPCASKILNCLAFPEQVPTLSSCSSFQIDFQQRCDKFRALARHVRQSLKPLSTSLPLRLPGFLSPTTMLVEGKSQYYSTRSGSETEPWQSGSQANLEEWLEEVGMGAFSPSESILALNAWTAREPGNQLSDFLREAFTRYFYIPRPPTRNYPHNGAGLLITFNYRGYEGIIWAGTLAEQRKQQMQQNTGPTAQ